MLKIIATTRGFALNTFMQTDAPEAQEEKFLAIISGLQLQQGDENCFYGWVNHTACLIKLATIDPPSLWIKLRMKSPLSGQSDWARLMNQKYPQSLVESEIRDDDISVFIFLSEALNAHEVREIIHSCITRHAKLLPSEPGYCYQCRGAGNAELEQKGQHVSSRCPECREKEPIKPPQLPDPEIPETREELAFLIPAAIILSATGWAGFWLSYHRVFSGYRNSITIGPACLVLLITFFIGYCLGFPVGKLLLRSGYSKYVSHYWLPFLLALLTIILGECLVMGWEIYQLFGEVSLSLISTNFSIMFFGGSILYTLYKLAFCVALGTSIHRVSLPGKVN